MLIINDSYWVLNSKLFHHNFYISLLSYDKICIYFLWEFYFCLGSIIVQITVSYAAQHSNIYPQIIISRVRVHSKILSLLPWDSIKNCKLILCKISSNISINIWLIIFILKALQTFISEESTKYKTIFKQKYLRRKYQ